MTNFFGRPPKIAVRGLEPISVSVHFQDGTSKNALVNSCDQKHAHKLNDIQGAETLAFVGM